MDFPELLDTLGEDGLAALGSLVIGLLFGFFAQRSRFCLRAATVEFARGMLGPKLAVWLLAFSAAVAATQGLILTGTLDVSEARQLASVGSLSGAIIGGLMFGAGMVLARGCASRLLVLSATGNLRALMTGLVLTIVAQASLRGGLSPVREFLSGLWTIGGNGADGGSRDMLVILGLDVTLAIMLALGGLGFAVFLAIRNRVSAWMAGGALVVGALIAAGWQFTYVMSTRTFDPVAVKSITFIGPSADTLMGLINEPMLPLGFDLGLVPGVFVGSLLAALLFRDFKWECFHYDKPMPRYMVGAALMGFGGMLAGGCAVGAGVSGSAVFSVTAWVALAAMWVGAGVTDYYVDRQAEAPAVEPAPLPAE